MPVYNKYQQVKISWTSIKKLKQMSPTVLLLFRAANMDKNKLCTTLKPYWKDRGRFTLNKELLLHSPCIVISQALQAETLKKVHLGHQRCRLRAKTSVWWLGMSQHLVEGCKLSTKYAPPKWKPLMSKPLPELFSWQKVANDLFHPDCG